MEREADVAAPAAYDTDRIATLPNVLSTLRLCGAPVMFWLIVGPQADGIAVAVLALGGLTDWLDGQLARRWHQTSPLGRLLDPIADRLYIFSVIVALGMRELVPWWLVAVLVARDLMMACLIPALNARGITALPVHFLGKAATFCLLYAFPLVLLGAGQGTGALVAKVLGWTFAIWGTALYWYAGALYLSRTIALVRRAPRLER